MRARDVMSSPVITVTPDTTAKDAADLLASNGFTALPVINDDDRLIGIVTEADVVRDRFPRDPRYRNAYQEEVLGVSARPHRPAATVGEVMTTSVISMGAGTDVVDLVTAMLDNKVRAMPIVDGSRVVGIVTRRDLLRVLARDDQQIATDIRHRLGNYGGPQRWTVNVHDGAAAIRDEFDNATDRHVVTVLAEAVPGVTSAEVTSKTAAG
jgi:CBS domain-containing protein